jgi:hypothetical protein
MSNPLARALELLISFSVQAHPQVSHFLFAYIVEGTVEALCVHSGCDTLLMLDSHRPATEYVI